MTEQAKEIVNPKDMWKETVQACKDKYLSVKQVALATNGVISSSKIYKDIEEGRFPGVIKHGEDGTKARISIAKESACRYFDKFHDTYEEKKKSKAPENKRFNFEYYEQSNVRL